MSNQFDKKKKNKLINQYGFSNIDFLHQNRRAHIIINKREN